MNKNIIGLFIMGVFIFGAIYIFSHLLILKGALIERAEKECVSASVITNWENTLNIAKEICVNSKDNYNQDVKLLYEKQIKKLEEDVKHWKNSYFWLKKQSQEKTEEK